MGREYIPVPYERYEELLLIESRYTTIKNITNMPIKEEGAEEIKDES